MTAAALMVGLVIVLVTPAASARATSATTGSGRPRSLTPAAIAAHLGRDAPEGWVPVDGPTARVYVPVGWTVAMEGDCLGTGTGIVSVGQLPTRDCFEFLSVPYPPTDGVAFLAGPTRMKGTPAKNVHGFAVYGPDTKTDPDWAIYTVPALATRLAVRGADADRILATLALPASTVAIDTARSIRPAALDAYEKSGRVATMSVAYKMFVPSTWTITEASNALCLWPQPGPPTVFIVRPGLSLPSCPGTGIPRSQNALVDGAVQYWPGAGPTGSATTAVNGEARLLTLRPSTSIVSVYQSALRPAVLDVKVAGVAAATTIVSVGLGRDGRVAGRIIASIAPNPDP